MGKCKFQKSVNYSTEVKDKAKKGAEGINKLSLRSALWVEKKERKKEGREEGR